MERLVTSCSISSFCSEVLGCFEVMNSSELLGLIEVVNSSEREDLHLSIGG